MSKLRAQLFTTLTPKYMMTIVVYAFNGTLGVCLPKSDVNMNPSIEIKRKERNVTKLPHPGSDFTSNSRKTTFRLHPRNTVIIASFTLRLVPRFNGSVDDVMSEDFRFIGSLYTIGVM